jgi:hypothetical protein
VIVSTKRAINTRLGALKKTLETRKKECLAAADEGGSAKISAKEFKFAASQLAWAIQRLEMFEEKIGKEEEKAAKADQDD